MIEVVLTNNQRFLIHPDDEASFLECGLRLPSYRGLVRGMDEWVGWYVNSKQIASWQIEEDDENLSSL